jgi:hypothetical protein
MLTLLNMLGIQIRITFETPENLVIMPPEQQIDPTFSACSRSSNGQILRKTHMGQPNDNVAALVNSKMTS